MACASGLVPAASQDAPSWSAPLNLSSTGGTSNPHLVVTGSGRRHVVWDVSFADSAYRFGDGQTWEDSIPIELPFKDTPATLLPDRAGNIHAFWVDDEGALFHKTVPANSLSSSGNWFGGQRLATSVAGYAVALDGQNRFHLGVIRAEDTAALPSGIYYLVSRAGGSTWSLPRRLYESNYYQQYLPSSTPGTGFPSTESDGPTIHIEAETADETTRLYMTWDNPAVRRVFQTTSVDAGSSWSEVEEVDGPSASDPYIAPRDLAVFALGDDVVRTWKAVAAGGNCSPRSQVSDDRGETWSEVRLGIGELEICPDFLKSLRLEDGQRLFLLEHVGQVFLAAWDGKQWSHPQPQPDLEFFVNPETFELVDLGCYQPAIVSGVLVVAGCDEGSGGDTWMTERALDDVRSWFGNDPAWVTATVALDEDTAPASLAVSADASGRTHFLWTEPKDGTDSGTDLRYAGFEDGQTIGPFPVFSALEGDPQGLALAVSPEGRLLAVWAESATGEIRLAWTVAGQADAATSWLKPIVLANTASASQSPAVVAGPGGKIYVAYTVPINEERGLYLVSSADAGKTWSEPRQVFDGAAGACAVVGPSNLALTPDGVVHAVWSCSTPPGGSGPLALIYTASADGGESWSPPTTLVDTPPVWSRLLAMPNGELHLIWQESRLGRTYTYHRRSTDRGATWSDPSSVVSTGGEAGPSVASSDDLGRIHLLQLVHERPDLPVLRYFLWDGSRWQSESWMPLAADAVQQIIGLGADVDASGNLVTAIAERASLNPAEANTYRVVVGSIAVPPSDSSIARLTQAAPTVGPDDEATAAPIDEATPAPPLPTPAFSTNVSGGSSGTLAVGLVAALASTAILLGVALAQRFRRPSAGPPPDDSAPSPSD